MASARLSNTSRDEIVKTVLTNRFDNERKALKKLKEELDAAVIRHALKDLPDAEKKDYSKYAKKNWLPMDDDLKLQFRPGSFVTYNFNTNIALPKFLFRVHLVEEVDPLYKLHGDYVTAKENLKKSEDEAKAAAKAIVYSCSSVKRLLEVWPEVERFVVGLGITEKQAALPAVQIDKVNSLLKLP